MNDVKLILSMKDRIGMGQLIPKQGSLIELTIAENITRKVNVSSEEMSTAGFKSIKDHQGNVVQYAWDEKREGAPKPFTFSQVEYEILRKGVQSLDSRKQITPDILDVCRKIMAISAEDAPMDDKENG